MTDLFEDIETVPADPPEVPPTPPDGPACEECGTVIAWAGRGRKPKRCPEHRTRTATTPDSTRQPRRSAKKEERLATLEADLLQEFAAFGKGLAKPLPTAGVVLVDRSERTARALTRLAADNPKLFAALEVIAKVAPAMDIGETGMMFGVAILVDTGRINPDALLPVITGVSPVWHDLNDKEDRTIQFPTQDVPSDTGFPEQTVPPRFMQIA